MHSSKKPKSDNDSKNVKKNTIIFLLKLTESKSEMSFSVFESLFCFLDL